VLAFFATISASAAKTASRFKDILGFNVQAEAARGAVRAELSSLIIGS